MQIEASQRHRVNRVINFARNSESEVLTLENLADVACLSPYHFSRVFTEHCKETPIEFLSRTRLEQSAMQLAYLPDKPVTTIALESGFSSPQAYSRAFHRRYGIPPRNFRVKNRSGVYEFPKNQFHISPLMSGMPTSRELYSPHHQSIKIEQTPEVRLAYIRHRGSYFNLSGTMDIAFARLEAWANMVGILNAESVMYGVCPNSPALTPPQYCQFDVGIPVGSDFEEDDVVSIQTIPAATIAKLTLVGCGKVNDAWRWFNAKWLPENGQLLTDISCYEQYKTKWDDTGPPQSIVELCMPIKLYNHAVK